MHANDNEAAGAVGVLAGLADLVLEAVSGVSMAKVVTAFVIAVATGLGYKLGSNVALYVWGKIKGKDK